MVRERRWSDIHQEYRWADTLDSRESPMTKAQGERIIQLLEQLVANSTPAPLPPAFIGALDEAISRDFDYRNGFPRLEEE